VRRLVLPGADARPADVPLVGSKAVHLARLGRCGQTVPRWYAVTTEAFAWARDSVPEIARVTDRLAAGESVDSVGRRVREAIASLTLPDELRRGIREAHRAGIGTDAPVAVRSSGTSEDGADASFAGLHDSFLWVNGEAAVLDAVRRVWASAYNDRALAYRRERSLPTDDISIGVIVQEMVDATTSGVLFTVNPATGDPGELVVSSLWGAGEGLVSAGLDADTFVVNRESLEIAETRAPKPTRLVRAPSGDGLVEEPVPEAEREAPSLTPAQIRTVAAAGFAIEREFHLPQDVEFSFDAGGRLHVLQARPVTTAQELGPAAGHRILWDNSNIIESYSGVTSPMTFSFIRHAYSTVYHCFCEVMGIPESTIRANRRMFRSMLGLIRGQVYYNLMNWHRLVKLFPGYRYNRAFMESMMGVGESTSLEEPEAPASWQQRYFRELPALIRLLLRSGTNFLRIGPIVADFEARFRRLHGRWESMDFDTMAPHELLDVYREMEEDLLAEWKAPIINDFYVMIFYGTLKKLCTSWCGDEAGTLQNDLLCGEGGLASTEPARRLIRLAAAARGQPELRRRLLEGDAEELALELPRDDRFPGFATAVAAYLDEFGYRCADELKLEEPSLRDRPAFLYRMLRNYLSADDDSLFDVEAQESRERKVRAEAEARADAALPSPRGLRRAVFRRVLRGARRGVKNRENLRLARTRIYGTLRELIRALGRRLAEAGEIGDPEDVFYLTLDEVQDFVAGTAVSTDLRGLVELRRREFDAYRTETDRVPHDRFETWGMVYHRNRFQPRRAAAGPDEDGLLRGIGCCPGEVTGPVKVILSLTGDAKLNGEILVAGRTDPGWVALYPAVSGLLIERGSILSHSAIVAREMGIPTIVGIPGLTTALETGRRVTMDGAAGTVRILDGDDAPPLDAATSAGEDSRAE
jgi:pyruvate,water dikinase